MRAPGPVVAALVAATLLTGCTTTTTGTPTSVRELASSSSTADAPDVRDPLDVSRFVSDPCATLDQAQLAGFGVSRPGTPDDSELAELSGPSCVWHASPEVNSTISIAFLALEQGGLGAEGACRRAKDVAAAAIATMTRAAR